jgi:hypothetical protein
MPEVNPAIAIPQHPRLASHRLSLQQKRQIGCSDPATLDPQIPHRLQSQVTQAGPFRPSLQACQVDLQGMAHRSWYPARSQPPLAFACALAGAQ